MRQALGLTWAREERRNKMESPSALDRVIFALDVPSIEEARDWVRRLPLKHFKVGLELFTQEGPAAVGAVAESGGRVFLDLKLHDIPSTVAGTMAAAVQAGVFLITVHTAGGPEMMRRAAAAAKEASERRGVPRPAVLGLTVLTSLDGGALRAVGVDREVMDLVVSRALLARECGLDGVVASPAEAAAVRSACGEDFLIVTPGIKMGARVGDDQRRVATPAKALGRGADYLVVGRAIRTAPDPVAALAQIEQDIRRWER